MNHKEYYIAIMECIYINILPFNYKNSNLDYNLL
ncbi:MAG: hypothetical protein JWM56_1158 [Candidatus Peribacteria bacterium]|nr:hypothetical protein [Candidatus Peribacteria bacterium]